MKITKPLNNNVVMALDPQKGEVVVVGTGIGFRAKAGDRLDRSKIQKVFVENENKKLVELIEQIPASYLELVEKIVKFSRERYHIQLQEDIYQLLTDHLYFALKRIQEGWDLDNPFLIDIKQYYQEEFQIGLYAKETIREMYGVEIPEYEVGYIAMHLVESGHNQDRRDFAEVFRVINESVRYLEENLPVVEKSRLSYARMVNHIKFFAKRYVENRENNAKDNLLIETIQETFKEEVKCMDGLSELLFRRFGRRISVSEKNYLVLHLRNCKEICD